MTSLLMRFLLNWGKTSSHLSTVKIIHTLATGLDDIADYIYASTKYIFPVQVSNDEGLCRFFITDSQGLSGDSECDEKPEGIQKYGAGKRSLY